MNQYIVYASICVFAESEEAAENAVRETLNVCTEPDNDLLGFIIESAEIVEHDVNDNVDPED